MDSKSGVEDSGLKSPMEPGGGEDSKMKGNGNISSEDMISRADKIDLKSLDMQLEKHLSRLMEPMVPFIVPLMIIKMLQLDLRHGIRRALADSTMSGWRHVKPLIKLKMAIIKLLDWGEDGFATTAETAALRTSFRQEVAVWHKLNHPNVTKFIGASMGTSNFKIPSKNPSAESLNPLPSKACCVVVEYLPGGTLKQYLLWTSLEGKRANLFFSFEGINNISLLTSTLIPNCSLSYLHSRKIVHRDVNTENMLLDAHRNLKIADFGVARVEAQNPQDMTGETGTLGYMAPEVLDGKPFKLQ
ncbi:Tesmin/TSO1-like CXC domain-containing protein, putative isoform 1 [Hibiscus syriacus]|uniref:Tesmin/TSO1-like CXC domain-containing protein, putative isoform 1 n=1 Tax=Hibiscus syriacus TaxID=106335 RepID=A0A6A3CLA7_HIBSY|nr:Tesmin/TSO1-like CXC domain-containing protein, putative isoform 1 [Hibiscus syriacus]